MNYLHQWAKTCVTQNVCHLFASPDLKGNNFWSLPTVVIKQTPFHVSNSPMPLGLIYQPKAAGSSRVDALTKWLARLSKEKDTLEREVEKEHCVITLLVEKKDIHAYTVVLFWTKRFILSFTHLLVQNSAGQIVHFNSPILVQHDSQSNQQWHALIIIINAPEVAATAGLNALYMGHWIAHEPDIGVDRKHAVPQPKCVPRFLDRETYEYPNTKKWNLMDNYFCW